MAVLSNFQNNSQSVEDDISLHPGVNAAHSDPHSSDAVQVEESAGRLEESAGRLERLLHTFVLPLQAAAGYWRPLFVVSAA